jgi:hypothetical protein
MKGAIIMVGDRMRGPSDSGEGPSSPKEINVTDLEKRRAKEWERQKAWEGETNRQQNLFGEMDAEDMIKYIEIKKEVTEKHHLEERDFNKNKPEAINALKELNDRIENILVWEKSLEWQQQKKRLEWLNRIIDSIDDVGIVAKYYQIIMGIKEEHKIEELKLKGEKYEMDDSNSNDEEYPSSQTLMALKEMNDKIAEIAQLAEIQPVKTNKRTSFGIYLRKPHRPERVEELVEDVNTDLKNTRYRMLNNHIPEDVRRKALEEIICITKEIDKLYGKACDYSKGIKGRKSRQDAENKIKGFKEIIKKINETLLIWKCDSIKRFQTSIGNASASSSNDAIPSIEQSVVNELVGELRNAHMQFLDCCHRSDDSQTLENALTIIEKVSERISILDSYSETWREINKVRARIEEKHAGGTDYDNLLNELFRGALDTIRGLYKKFLNKCQQLGEEPERLQNDFLQAYDRFMVLNNAVESIETKMQNLYDPQYLEHRKENMIGTIIKNFNNSSDQVEDGHREDKGEGREARSQDEKRIEGLIGKLQEMSEDLDRWHRVKESVRELSQSLYSYTPKEYRKLARTLAGKAVATAYEAYEQVLAGYQEGSDQSDARKRFEKACCWLEERPGALKTVCEEQINSYVGYPEEDFDSAWTRKFREVRILKERNPEAWQQYLKAGDEYSANPETRLPHEWLQLFKHLRDNLDTELRQIDSQDEQGCMERKWEKHLLDHKRILACIGDHKKQEMDQKMNEYTDEMEKLYNDITDRLEWQGLITANSYINRFIHTKEYFNIIYSDVGEGSSSREGIKYRDFIKDQTEEREHQSTWKDEIKQLSGFCERMICDAKMYEKYCKILKNVKNKYKLKTLTLEDETSPSPVAIVAVIEINEKLGKILIPESGSSHGFDQESQQELEQKNNEIRPSKHSYNRLEDSYYKFENSKLSVEWKKFEENINEYDFIKLGNIEGYSHIEGYEYARISSLSGLMMTEAKNSYQEMLSVYKQSNGDSEQLWSIHEDFQEACRQVEAFWWSIEPKKVGRSDIASREDRVERVNKAIDMFNKTVQDIKGELDAGYFTKEEKEKTLEVTFALISCFDEYANKALKDHDISGSKYEAGIKYINKGIEDINGYIRICKYINIFQARMKNTSASSDDSGSLGKVIGNLKREVELDYMYALDTYSHFVNNYYQNCNVHFKNVEGVFTDEIILEPFSLKMRDININTARGNWIVFGKASQAWEKVQEIQRNGIILENKEDMGMVEKLIEFANNTYNGILDPKSNRYAWKLYAKNIEEAYQSLRDIKKTSDS